VLLGYEIDVVVATDPLKSTRRSKSSIPSEVDTVESIVEEMEKDADLAERGERQRQPDGNRST
jgi:hypothetical protein